MNIFRSVKLHENTCQKFRVVSQQEAAWILLGPALAESSRMEIKGLVCQPARKISLSAFFCPLAFSYSSRISTFREAPRDGDDVICPVRGKPNSLPNRYPRA